MAIYNLFDGGTIFMQGGCASCNDKHLDEDGLPFVVQPDLRADGGYGFRHKTDWVALMARLEQAYGKGEGDLKVGDRLRIFVQPNHATLKSVFVDFKHAVSGFAFKFETVRGLSLKTNAIIHRTKYDAASGEIKEFTKTGVDFAADQANGVVVDNTQYTFKTPAMLDPSSAKVDAIELVIEALPVNGLAGRDFCAWFARRFEQDGLMI